MMAHAAYLVRLQLRPAGHSMMESILGRSNWLYNQALEIRKTACQQRRQSLSFYDQCQWLTPLRAAREYGLGEIAGGANRGMLKWLGHAFQSFSSPRCSATTACRNPGHPAGRRSHESPLRSQARNPEAPPADPCSRPCGAGPGTPRPTLNTEFPRFPA